MKSITAAWWAGDGRRVQFLEADGRLVDQLHDGVGGIDRLALQGLDDCDEGNLGGDPAEGDEPGAWK